MRFSFCFKVVKKRGFFLGPQLVIYRRRWAGYLTLGGLGPWARRLVFETSDGILSNSFYKRKLKEKTYFFKIKRAKAMGLLALYFYPPHISPAWPWAWTILKYLKNRSWRGRRYRLGLPARGQRTRSNCSTVKRHKDIASLYIKQRKWATTLWQGSKKQNLTKKNQTKGTSKRSIKAERHKKGVIRTKDLKKKTVWS